MDPLPLITVSGTPAECGGAYGAAAADRIRANLDAYARRFSEQAGLDEAAVRAAGSRLSGVTREYEPRIAQMLAAMGEAAGGDPKPGDAMNGRTELLATPRHGRARGARG